MRFRSIIFLLFLQPIISSCGAQNSEVPLFQKIDCQANQVDPDRVVYGLNSNMFIPSYDFRTDFPVDKYVPQFLKVSQNLSSQGIKLIIVPLSHKGLVRVDQLDLSDPIQSSYNWASARNQYNSFVRQLSESNIAVVDTLTPFLNSRMQIFNKTDWHWNSEGAQILAKQVGKAIGNISLSTPLTKKSYQTRLIGKLDLTGTSAYYASQIEKRCGTSLQSHEQVNHYETVETGSSTNLLDSDDPDIVLVGTSFSVQPWNFDGFIKQETGNDVLNTAVIGGGVNSSIQSYLLSDTYKEHKPKIIVWEFDFDRLYDTPLEQQHWGQLLAMTSANCTNEVQIGSYPVTYPSISFSLRSATNKIVHLKFSDRSLLFFYATPVKDSKMLPPISVGRWGFIKNTGDYYVSHNEADALKLDIPDFQKDVKGEVVVSLCDTWRN